MSDTLKFIFIIIGYILVGFIVIKVLPKKISNLQLGFRLGILSFCYAFVFGIGAAASGGDPGFAFPAPVILALFLTNIKLIVNSALIPLIFWWILIFLYLRTKHLLKQRKIKNKKINAT